VHIEPLERRLCPAAVPLLPPEVHNVARGADSIVCDYLDGDDYLDLAVTDPRGGTVAVLYGREDGSFRRPVNFAAGTGATQIRLDYVQWDDDIPDLIVANPQTHSVTVLLGLGDGTFAAPITSDAGVEAVAFDADFLNDDDFLDVVVAGTSGGEGALMLLLGNGDGTFAAPIRLAGGAPFGGVVIDDFNDDWVYDIAATDPAAGEALVFIGNSEGSVSEGFVGDGTFAAPVRFAAGRGATAITAGDFNNDWVWDLAVAAPGDNAVVILLGNTSRFARDVPEPVTAPVVQSQSWWIAPDLSTWPVRTRTLQLSFADIDWGGLGLAPPDDGYYEDADGTFAAPVVLSVAGSPTIVQTAQFNDDGIDDFIALDPETGTATVVLGCEEGPFDGSTTLDLGRGTAAVALGSFDFDEGVTDVAVVNPQTGRVSILRQYAVDLSVGSSPPYALDEDGNELEYWLYVDNYDRRDATGVVFTYTLPEGSTLVSAETTRGTVDTSQPGKVVVHVGKLAGAGPDGESYDENSTAEITIVLRPGPGGSVQDQFEVRADQADPEEWNNSGTSGPPVIIDWTPVAPEIDPSGMELGGTISIAVPDEQGNDPAAPPTGAAESSLPLTFATTTLPAEARFSWEREGDGRSESQSAAGAVFDSGGEEEKADSLAALVQ
jgi:uncharacterized repeat protein (TIGR01451 family)